MRLKKALITFLAWAPWTTGSVLSPRAQRHVEGKGQDTRPQRYFRAYRSELPNPPVSAVSGTISQDELDLIQRSLGMQVAWAGSLKFEH